MESLNWRGVLSRKPVIVRFSDFKTNEYRTLIGGELYETAGRKTDDRLARRFKILSSEFRAGVYFRIKSDEKSPRGNGLDNIAMVPFLPHPEDAKSFRNY